MGPPDEITAAVAWLADEAPCVTGTALFVDGGVTHYAG
jgi:NAD(P)-dependent dehydrogenase (short-subunit alcohol dehydrogenase family)